MSRERDQLEAAQARLRELETNTISDEQLSLLATALEREVATYEALLVKGERRALAREVTNQATRLMTFGFALVFVTPMVAMIGVSAAKELRHQPEAAVASMVIGVMFILGVMWGRARESVVRLFSAEWRFVRRARRTAASVRQLVQ